MEMAWPCVKSGAHSAYKNRTDMGSEGGKEKGRPKTTWRRTVMEEMRERWYWLGESYKTIAQDRAISRDLDEAMCHRPSWN